MRSLLARTGLATLTLLAVGVTAGCSDDAADGEPASTSSAAPVAEGDCPLLPVDAVSAATGGAATLVVGDELHCLFTVAGPGRDLGVEIVVGPLLTDDALGEAEGSRGQCEGEVVEVAVGEAAFACRTPLGPQGFVYGPSRSVVLTLDRPSPDRFDVGVAAAMLSDLEVP